MKIFIFGKEADQIREDARSKERKVCESHYLDEERKLRKQYADDKDKLRKDYTKELRDLETTLVEHYERIIKGMKEEVSRKDNQLRCSQDAWELFKGVLPELKNYASLLEVKAEANSMSKARELSQARELDQGLENIQRKVRLITPDVDKLLSLEIIPSSLK